MGITRQTSGGQWTIPYKLTATADTPITFMVQPRRGFRAILEMFSFTQATTDQNNRWKNPYTKVAAAVEAAKAATTLVISRDPGAYAAMWAAQGRSAPMISDNAIAASDVIGVRLQNGKVVPIIVSAVGSYTDPVTGNTDPLKKSLTVPALADKVLKGAEVWFFGATSDTNPRTNDTEYVLASGTAGAVVTGASGDTLVRGLGVGEPMLFYGPNATTAGTLSIAQGRYDY